MYPADAAQFMGIPSDRSIILEDRDTCDACLRVCAKQNLVEEMGIGLREFSWPDRWWFSEENKMIEAADTDLEIDRMHDLFARVESEEYPHQDISAAEWLTQQVGESRQNRAE